MQVEEERDDHDRRDDHARRASWRRRRRRARRCTGRRPASAARGRGGSGAGGSAARASSRAAGSSPARAGRGRAAPIPSTTASAYRRVQIRTPRPASASSGMSQPRNTKLSRPVRTCRVIRSSPDAEYCSTSARLRPPPVIDPGNGQGRDQGPTADPGDARGEPRDERARLPVGAQNDVEEEERHRGQRQVDVGERDRGERDPRKHRPPAAPLQRRARRRTARAGAGSRSARGSVPCSAPPDTARARTRARRPVPLHGLTRAAVTMRA